MATKSVVCPECGAAAAPGRYACAECGALLASVAGVPRAWTTIEATAATVASPTADGAKAQARRPGSRTRKAAPATPPSPAPVTAAAPPAVPAVPAAPVAAAIAVEPPSAPDPIDEPVRAREPGVVDSDEIEARRASLAPLSPSWPQPGDREPFPPRIERTPAGAYLAPSAVLPPLDAPAIARNGHGGAGGASHAANATHPAAPTADSRPGTPRVSLTERLDAFGITAEMPRRVAGAGAAVAALGFALPWRNSPFGGSLIDDYLAHWGLAGAGNWIVVLVLLAMTAIGVTNGRLARLPMGLASVAVATLLIGLLWPSLFGLAVKPVGVWIVLAGALLLAAGGILATRRHEPAESPV
jgi:hypothetical protein